MSADYGPAVWYPLSKFFWPNQNKPRYVIIHGTAGGSSAKGIGDYYRSLEQSGVRQSSVHFCIGVQGEVYQFVAVKDAAWGNGNITVGHDPWWTPNPNNYTISIEHCKPHSDNSDVLTEPQKASSFALVKHLCEQWAIPKRPADAAGGIAPHSSIDPVNRARCPGPYPWTELYHYLETGEQTMVPHGWTDSNGVLTAPNGIPINGAFRQYVLNFPGGFPAENYPQQLIRGTGTPTDPYMLTFLYWEVGYIDNGVVYYTSIGAEVLTLRKNQGQSTPARAAEAQACMDDIVAYVTKYPTLK